MYWIPIIFIIMNFLYITQYKEITRMLCAKKLYEKYKDYKIQEYIDSEFEFHNKLFNIISVFFIFEFIYFMVAFFYPIWIYSAVYIALVIIISTKKELSLEKIIKLAKLNGFQASDVKLARMLKISELENKDVKVNIWLNYLLIGLKIMAFISIIVLHYNYKIF